MQKFKDLFYDDLSVARGNYFLTLLSAFLITIILLIGFVVSDTHILYGVFIVLIGIVLLRLFKINLLSFKKLTMSQVIYIIGGALLIYGLDHLYLHFHDVPTNEQELDQEYNICLCICLLSQLLLSLPLSEEIVFRGMMIRVVFRKYLFIGLSCLSLVFASLHESDTWIAYLPYLCSGVIFGLILKTKRFRSRYFNPLYKQPILIIILIWG